jgi:hypothetical protein
MVSIYPALWAFNTLIVQKKFSLRTVLCTGNGHPRAITPVQGNACPSANKKRKKELPYLSLRASGPRNLKKITQR